MFHTLSSVLTAIASGQIAPVARSRDMTVVMRNARGFADAGIDVIDPWTDTCALHRRSGRTPEPPDSKGQDPCPRGGNLHQREMGGRRSRLQPGAGFRRKCAVSPGPAKAVTGSVRPADSVANGHDLGNRARNPPPGSRRLNRSPLRFRSIRHSWSAGLEMMKRRPDWPGPAGLSRAVEHT